MKNKANIKHEIFFIKMILKSLLRRRSRMLAALLAVAVGGAIFSGLLILYYDMPRQMGREFRSYGANFLITPAGENTQLDMASAEKALLYCPPGSIIGAAPYRYTTIKINEQPFILAGTVMEEVKKTSPYWLVSGNWPEKQGEALAGAETAEILRLVPRSSFTINGILNSGEKNFSNSAVEYKFRTSGFLQTGGAEENFVFITLEDFDAIMGNSGVADMVECSISLDAKTLETIAEKIHTVFPDLDANLVRRITQSEVTVLKKLNALVFIVTFIVLLLIFICVASTMMAVVTERRKEIGLHKALGASNNNLTAEFTGEALFLGCTGGILGSIAGFGFAQFIGIKVFGRIVMFQPVLIIFTIVISMLITMLASFLPVKNAVKVDPAVVLRGE
jgi:putative ABC transport system permease protein